MKKAKTSKERKALKDFQVKKVVVTLLNGGFLLCGPYGTSKVGYRLYSSPGNPELNIKSIKQFGDIFKKTKDKRILISRSKVRKLHGNDIVKIIYRQHFKKTEITFGTGQLVTTNKSVIEFLGAKREQVETSSPNQN